MGGACDQYRETADGRPPFCGVILYKAPPNGARLGDISPLNQVEDGDIFLKDTSDTNKWKEPQMVQNDQGRNVMNGPTLHRQVLDKTLFRRSNWRRSDAPNGGSRGMEGTKNILAGGFSYNPRPGDGVVSNSGSFNWPQPHTVDYNGDFYNQKKGMQEKEEKKLIEAVIYSWKWWDPKKDGETRISIEQLMRDYDISKSNDKHVPAFVAARATAPHHPGTPHTGNAAVTAKPGFSTGSVVSTGSTGSRPGTRHTLPLKGPLSVYTIIADAAGTAQQFPSTVPMYSIALPFGDRIMALKNALKGLRTLSATNFEAQLRDTGFPM